MRLEHGVGDTAPAPSPVPASGPQQHGSWCPEPWHKATSSRYPSPKSFLCSCCVLHAPLQDYCFMVEIANLLSPTLKAAEVIPTVQRLVPCTDAVARKVCRGACLPWGFDCDCQGVCRTGTVQALPSHPHAPSICHHPFIAPSPSPWPSLSPHPHPRPHPHPHPLPSSPPLPRPH